MLFIHCYILVSPLTFSHPKNCLSISTMLMTKFGLWIYCLQKSGFLQISCGVGVWRLSPLPAINEASLRFAESASNFGRSLANLVEYTVARDVRENLIGPISGRTRSVESNGNTTVDHETATVNLPSTRVDTSTVAVGTSTARANGNGTAVESSSILSTLSVERATSLFSSTGAAVMDMGQQFLSFPPSVWNGSVLFTDFSLVGKDVLSFHDSWTVA
jgi:hypothetical protein